MPPPRKRAERPLKALPALPDLGPKAPNGQGKGDQSSVKKWDAAGRPIGKNRAYNESKKVLNSGPDMPPGRYMSWLPKPEEVPPKPTELPEMEWPGMGHHRDGEPEWHLHSYMMPNAKALAEAGEPYVVERLWEARWVPPTEKRCQARAIGKFSEWQGNRCTMMAIKGGKVCRTHGGKLTNVRKAAANALAMAALPAAQRLIHIALKKRGVADSDRIKAIIQILDRAGVEGRQTIELEIKPWQEVLERVYQKDTGRPITDEEIEGEDYELLDDGEVEEDDDDDA